jgi:hypothetical protein
VFWKESKFADRNAICGKWKGMFAGFSFLQFFSPLPAALLSLSGLLRLENP